MWIDLKTGIVAQLHSDVRRLRPNWSGPNVMTDEMIADLGFVQIMPTTPECDPIRQVKTELAPALIDDVWTQQWEVTNLPAETVESNLNAAKVKAWDDICARRDAREDRGFKLGEHWFHSDAKSQVKYLGLKDKARDLVAAGGSMTDVIQEQGQNITWHTLDNADVPVTAQLAFDLVAAVATLQATVFAIAKMHRAAMEKSSRPDLYDFAANWPTAYEGA